MAADFTISSSGGERHPTLSLFLNTTDANGTTVGNQIVAQMDYAGAVELRKELDKAIAQIDKARQTGLSLPGR